MAKAAIHITDASYIHGRTGTHMRHTVNITLGPTLVWSIEGCLAFRSRKGNILFKPPIIYINRPDKKLTYRNNKVSPDLTRMIEEGIEKKYGIHITRKLETVHHLGVRASQYDPSLPDVAEIDLGE